MFVTVTVIVDGALEEEETFRDYLLFDHYLSSLKEDAASHGYPTDVFALYHLHDEDAGHCECIQFETDHSPIWSSHP